MVNWWFRLVVWIPGIPLWKGLSNCYLGVPLESQTTNPNHQLTVSWYNTSQQKQTVGTDQEATPKGRQMSSSHPFQKVLHYVSFREGTPPENKHFEQKMNLFLAKKKRKPKSMILPTYPGKIPQTSPKHLQFERNSQTWTVGETSGLSSRAMWVRS